MKINSSTDIFYQDTCGHATFHLQCSTPGSQGHWDREQVAGGREGAEAQSLRWLQIEK